jgi:Flp pilus assembly pilin Flp
MIQTLCRFWRDDEGQDLIEYSLLITFIVVACMWFVGAGASPVKTIWTSANNQVTRADAIAAGN